MKETNNLRCSRDIYVLAINLQKPITTQFFRHVAREDLE